MAFCRIDKILVEGFQVVRGLLQPQPTSLAARLTTVEVDRTAVPGQAAAPLAEATAMATPSRAAAQSTPASPVVALANAIPITIGDKVQEEKPAASAGKIDAPGTHDVYTFTAAAGQQVFFQLKAHEGLAHVNWRLEVRMGRCCSTSAWAAARSDCRRSRAAAPTCSRSAAIRRPRSAATHFSLSRSSS
jgi:hypothetical protein